MEQDHVLADYNNRFIPTLNDFVTAFEELQEDELASINQIYAYYAGHKDIQALLVSPLNVTGQLKALRLTHNTWFCNEILPKIFNTTYNLGTFGSIQLFDNMKFKAWMDNGNALPPSCSKIKSLL